MIYSKHPVLKLNLICTCAYLCKCFVVIHLGYVNVDLIFISFMYSIILLPFFMWAVSRYWKLFSNYPPVPEMYLSHTWSSSL